MYGCAVERDQRVVRDRDDAAARIAAGVAERVVLLDINLTDAGFFPQLAQRGLLEGFALQDEATRYGPASSVRVDAAPHEQEVEGTVTDREDDDVDRNLNARGPRGGSFHRFPFPGDTTSRARCSAARTCAVAPDSKRRKSVSTPSLKMTPPAGISDSSTSSPPASIQPATRLAVDCRLTNGSRTANNNRGSSHAMPSAVPGLPP